MKNSKIFKIFIVIGVLIIPFMYSFFYLKAYWDPYGAGNIDNIPVAIVNNDFGDKGSELIDSIKSKKKLKLSVVSEDKGKDGLYNKKYYALITIPDDFTSSMESAGSSNKKHATITYSPNQKSNFLASQIINNVINVVEKNLDNTVNSTIVSNLEDTINGVPNSMNTISDGFSKLSDGANQLNNGGIELNNGIGTLSNKYGLFDNGVNTLNGGISTLNSKYKLFDDGVNTLNGGIKDLNNNYILFNNGINDIKNGVNTLDNNYKMFNEGVNNLSRGVSTLNEASSELDGLKAGINDLGNGILELKNGSDTVTSGVNNYVDSVDKALSGSEVLANYLLNNVCNKESLSEEELMVCGVSTNLNNNINTIKSSGNSVKMGTNMVNSGINTLNSKVSMFSGVGAKIDELKNGINTINSGSSMLVGFSNDIYSGINTINGGIDTLVINSNKILGGINTISVGSNTLSSSSNDVKSGILELYKGSNRLSSSSNEVVSGISTLGNGAVALSDGINTLYTSVNGAKLELDNKLDDTKKDLDKVKGLGNYSKEPVKIKNKVVNEVSSYGVAFSPLFISIALWVGCLMMFMVFYYDKDERFKILGMNNANRVQRTLVYHLMASISGIVLGFLLNGLLDFELTNVILYYFSLVLVANVFMAIMEMLIINFGDIGKFMALVILVLQLASSGGTFPIETVTKCFRWLNSILPMKYTVDLFKESLISYDSKLFGNSVLVLVMVFVIIFVLNIIGDVIRNKRYN